MKKAQPTQRKYLAVAIATAGLAQLHAVSVHADEPSYQLEQIIVTAQKSDDRAQDIPSTINVVTGSTLENLEIKKFADLTQVTAGLSLDVLSGRRQTVNLRGVQSNPDAGFQDGVAVYWNDMVVKTDVAFQQMFDIDRIEVLRGPQGTLQGATSPAGAIKLNTRMPYLDGFRGNISQSFSDNGSSNTEGGVDLPIILDKLAVRIAGVYDDSAINDIKNVTTGREPTSMTQAGRLSAFFQPTDDFSAKLAYEYLNKNADGPETIAGIQAGKPSYRVYDRKSVSSFNNIDNNRNNLLSLNLQWDLGINQLVYETGYYNSHADSYRDSDVGNLSTANTLNRILAKTERLVQEFRVTTEISEDWTSLVGVYYQKDSSKALAVVPSTATITATNDIRSHAETYALFTHQKYQLTENGLIEMGLRYQKVNQFNGSDLFVANSATGITTKTGQIPAARAHDADAEIVTGSLKYSYTFTPDLMAYASYDSSFRPGGFVATSRAFVPAQYLTYESEKSQGVELGVKSAWLDNRLQLNGDIFYQVFDGGLYRSQALLLNTDGIVGVIPTTVGTNTNANAERTTARLVYNADSIIQGIEVEAQYLLTRDWQIGANVSYVDAKYDDAEVPGNSPTPLTQVPVVYTVTSSGRAGSEPNWSATANSNYTLPLGPVDAYLNVLVKYVSSREDDQLSAARGNNAGLVKGFSTTNLYLGVKDINDVWDIALFAKNVFDKNGQTAVPEIGDGATTYFLVRTNEPRVIGISGTYNFGKS
jgi:iron complex outermembrane receptor protein